MIIRWSPDALETVEEICEFIDNINAEDSSTFWLSKFSLFIHSYAKPHVQYALCRYKTFEQRGLSCINYFGWVIAFKIEEDEFMVHHIVRGLLLT